MNTSVKISVCDRRTNARYKNQEKTWLELKDRCRAPVCTSETVLEYPKLKKDARDLLKDQGGFVGGWLREGIRKNGNVICRSVGALDADSIPADADFPAQVKKALPEIEWFLYSTHSHTPESPRFRLVILFSREVTEDEYPAVMRQVAKDIGIDFFDLSTYQANRMMYWPSCPSDGEFVFEESVGMPLTPDAYLSRYENWKDISQWPVSSRQSEVIRKSASVQQDPLQKEGVVGAFCRTFFPVQNALRKFLPDVYEPSRSENRWDYIHAESSAGVVIYDDRFIYSHHTSDPACGKLLNAFDAVRLHRFGDDDSKKSFREMSALAMAQDEVKLLLDQERREKVIQGFQSLSAERESAQADGQEAEAREWTKQLVFDPRTGAPVNSTFNLMFILTHDPDLRNFAYNEMARRVQVTGRLPWDRPLGNKYWRDGDTAQLKVFLDSRYGVFSDRVLEACFVKTSEDRRFHPVRDYLNGLPPWDGEHRIETLLVRCLGADDTPYTRAVTRKTFAAAVARILKPGEKFDCIIVLDGHQGIGKSSIFRLLCGAEYYSETLSLTDMSDKSGAEKLQGYWIVEIGELAGMRKADIEKVKAFLSTTDDAYRPSYGRVVESHPRQCIIVATVNGENGYLRDTTGNRRFWVVKCRQKEQQMKFSFTAGERDQIWAEALWLWNHGEKLYLEDSLREEAEQIQRSAMEEDDRQGLVEEYLNMLLPLQWTEMEIYERRMWLSGQDHMSRGKGVIRRESVSNIEIWTECFGNDPMKMKSQDAYAIAAIMTKIDGWNKTGRRQRLPLYGMQRLYVRTDRDPHPGPQPSCAPSCVPTESEENPVTTVTDVTASSESSDVAYCIPTDSEENPVTTVTTSSESSDVASYIPTDSDENRVTTVTDVTASSESFGVALCDSEESGEALYEFLL